MHVTEAEYAQALLGLLIPRSLVGTATSKKGPYFRGLDRELSHNHWLIKTEDETKVRDAEKYLSFDVSIDFRNARLGDVGCLHDALTKRLLCIELLKQNATARHVSANLVVSVLNQFDWYTRWRNSRQIATNGLVTNADFDAYKAVTTNDITHLLPLEKRLDALVADRHYIFPIYSHGKRYRLDWVAFADMLGVNHLALGRSKTFRDALALRIQSFLRDTGVESKSLDLYVGGSNPRPAEQLTSNASRMYIWEVLDRLSVKNLLAHDPLTFRVPPTPTIKLDAGRTRSLLPHDMMRVLELASKWVAIYGDFILSAVEARSTLPERAAWNSPPMILDLMKRINDERPDGMPPLNLGLSATFPAPPGTLRLSKAVAYLYLSCAILIAGFGGRRVNEVRYLQEDCIYRGNTAKLTIYIEKTLRDVDAIPVPEAVVLAVNLLERMSFKARLRSSDKWLFQFYHPFSDRQKLDVSTKFAALLHEFFEVANLEPPDGAPAWAIAFHMLRKGFVISYYHGNIWGTFDGANRMLRHTSADMTAIYMDDEVIGALSWLRSEVSRLTKRALADLSPEEGRYLKDAKSAIAEHGQRKTIWDEGRQEFFVSRMMDIYDGEERPIGKGAARMLDLLHEMEAKALKLIHFSAAPTNGHEAVRESVLNQVKIAAVNHFMEPVPGGLLYCGFKRGDARHSAMANCLMDRSAKRISWEQNQPSSSDTRPDYAFSGLYTCLGCDLCLLLNKNQSDVREAVDRMKREIPDAASNELAESAKAYIDEIFNLIVGAERAVDGKQRPR